MRAEHFARDVMEATRRLIDGVAAIDGVHVWGEPDMSVVAIGSREHDVYAIGDVLEARGWHFEAVPGGVQLPAPRPLFKKLEVSAEEAA